MSNVAVITNLQIRACSKNSEKFKGTGCMLIFAKNLVVAPPPQFLCAKISFKQFLFLVKTSGKKGELPFLESEN